MALEKISQVKGTGVPIPGDDVDTDRIIPARFMKCVTFDGLGEYAFYDVRFDEDGNKKDYPINDAKYEGASILVCGNNFGCGSSREHAPQSIARAGFVGIIAESFAEIFFGNCTTLGVPCLSVSRSDREEIQKRIAVDPTLEITIDVDSQKAIVGDKEFAGSIVETARDALMAGRWDPMQELLDQADAVDALAAGLPYVLKK